MQGGGIDVIGNYAFGHRDAAFIYHMKPSMTEGGVGVKFAPKEKKTQLELGF